MTKSRSRRTSLGVLGASAAVLGVGPWLGPAPARPPTPAADHVAHGHPADDDSSWPLIAVAAIAGTGVLVTIGGSMALYARKRLRDARLGTMGTATTPDPADDTDAAVEADGPTQASAPPGDDPTPTRPADGPPQKSAPRDPTSGQPAGGRPQVSAPANSADDPSQKPAPGRRDPPPGNRTTNRAARRPDDGHAGPPPASAGAP